jgi:hypothetical protein
VALIETRFAAGPVCGHCRSETFGSWGVANGSSATNAGAAHAHSTP